MRRIAVPVASSVRVVLRGRPPGSLERLVRARSRTPRDAARRFDDAERHFEHALEVNKAIGARPWLAYTQEDYGRLLVERGDEERGRSLVEEALATYRELGMERSLRGARPS